MNRHLGAGHKLEESDWSIDGGTVPYKFKEKWLGPYRVEEVRIPMASIVSVEDPHRPPKTVSFSQLKPMTEDAYLSYLDQFPDGRFEDPIYDTIEAQLEPEADEED